MTQQLRPRHIYWRPAGRFVGFGQNHPEQPDLMESEFRAGWWIVVVCRICLLAERRRLQRMNAALQADIDRIRALAHNASLRVGAAGAIIDKKIEEIGGDQRKPK